MITEVPIFGFMKSRQTFYMLASVLPITHGRSVVNHAGPPATHNLCCVAAAAADSRNTLQRSIFYFCYLYGLYTSQVVHMFSIKSIKNNILYILFSDFYSLICLYVRFMTVRQLWNIFLELFFRSPGECEHWRNAWRQWFPHFLHFFVDSIFMFLIENKHKSQRLKKTELSLALHNIVEVTVLTILYNYSVFVLITWECLGH